MDDGWWYAEGGEKKGPHAAAQFRALMRAGVVGPHTWVWHPGLPQWQTVAGTPGLVDWLPATPPDIPEPAVAATPPQDTDGPREPHLDFDAPLVRAQAPVPRTARAAAALALPLAGPWRRFFAQMIDLWGLCMVAGFLLGVVAAMYLPRLQMWLEHPSNTALLGLMIVPLALLLQALLLGLFGTTPGKLLLGLRVVSLRGERLGLGDAVGRTLGLYWYGLALGVPLVALVTMGVQHGRVSKGRRARYDEDRFDVRAAPLGLGRGAASVLVVVLLCVLVGYFNVREREQSRSFFGGFEWTNPVTGRNASVPGGWSAREQANEDGEPLYMFSAPAQGVTAIFAKETVPEGMDLPAYQRLWARAVREAMALEPDAMPLTVGDRATLMMTGTLADDRTRRVHVTLVRTGRQMWRLVLVSVGNRPPETAATARLRETLLRSLGPQDTPSSPARTGGQAV